MNWLVIPPRLWSSGDCRLTSPWLKEDWKKGSFPAIKPIKQSLLFPQWSLPSRNSIPCSAFVDGFNESP